MRVKIFTDTRLDTVEGAINTWLSSPVNIEVKHTNLAAFDAGDACVYVITVWYDAAD